MTQIWYQVEPLSKIDDVWVPLFGRHTTIESARDAASTIMVGIPHDHHHHKEFETRIIHVEQTRKVVQ